MTPIPSVSKILFFVAVVAVAVKTANLTLESKSKRNSYKLRYHLRNGELLADAYPLKAKKVLNSNLIDNKCAYRIPRPD